MDNVSEHCVFVDTVEGLQTKTWKILFFLWYVVILHTHIPFNSLLSPPPTHFLSKAVIKYNSDINKKNKLCELREW